MVERDYRATIYRRWDVVVVGQEDLLMAVEIKDTAPLGAAISVIPMTGYLI